jgi:O-acetyl-ADP-ribose deacetylase (regulator of RNase III)
MTIISKSGNLLESNAQALVNTVNCVGIMGKGLALQFREAFPLMYRNYRDDCHNGLYHPGDVWGYIDRPRDIFIFNVATKDHWRDPSQLAWIQLGIDGLKRRLLNSSIKSVAIPPLGCGLGGLSWSEVRPLIVAAFQDLEIEVQLYEPKQ